MPALEALLDQFEAANTQPLGLSVDSVYCHAAWARSIGGVSFPLLSDFHPKGALAKSLGLYLDGAGITDRATVLIDAGGIVRHASSVGPGGQRDVHELLSRCQDIDAAFTGDLERPAKTGVPAETKLYIKSSCGFSRSVLDACENLQLDLAVANVHDDPAAMGELKAATGKEQAPCLVIDGKPMLESADIVRELVSRKTGLWG